MKVWLYRSNIINGLDYDVTKDIKFCEPCVDGKHHHSSFPKSSGRRATKLLEIVHSDVCGRLEAKSLSGAEYFITFLMINQDMYGYTFLKTKVKFLKNS